MIKNSNQFRSSYNSISGINNPNQGFVPNQDVRASQSSQKIMPSSGANGQLGQATKKNILMAYNSKSGTKPSKVGERYQELGKIYN